MRSKTFRDQYVDDWKYHLKNHYLIELTRIWWALRHC